MAILFYLNYPKRVRGKHIVKAFPFGAKGIGYEITNLWSTSNVLHDVVFEVENRDSMTAEEMMQRVVDHIYEYADHIKEDAEYKLIDVIDDREA